MIFSRTFIACHMQEFMHCVLPFVIAGESYKKGMVMFKFLVYYAIPLCVIAGFYLGMARHLKLSTRNMPGELSSGGHRMEQIRARKKVWYWSAGNFVKDNSRLKFNF